MCQDFKIQGNLFEIDYEKFLISRLNDALGKRDHTEAVKYRKALVSHYNGNMVKLTIPKSFPFSSTYAVNPCK